MAVPTAERDERAVEAVVPGAIFIHVPQTVLVPTDCKTSATQSVKPGNTTGRMIKKDKVKEAERERVEDAAGQTDSLFSKRIYFPSYDLCCCLCFVTHFQGEMLLCSACRRK